MSELEYIEKFDRVLRKHLRPFLLSVIQKITEANLKTCDLVCEYCEDNNLKYVGDKPERLETDKAILVGLTIGEAYSRKVIEEIAQEEVGSPRRKEFTAAILRGMDVQAAMRLFVFRWFESSMNPKGNKVREIAKVLGIQMNIVPLLKDAMKVLIGDRNKGLAHYSENSQMDADEYDTKMFRVEQIFSELRNVDRARYQAFKEERVEKKQGVTFDKKWLFLGIGFLFAIALIFLGAFLGTRGNDETNQTPQNQNGAIVNQNGTADQKENETEEENKETNQESQQGQTTQGTPTSQASKLKTGTAKYQGLEFEATATAKDSVNIRFTNNSERGYSIGWVGGGDVTLLTTEGQFTYTIGNSIKINPGSSCMEVCYFENVVGDIVSVTVHEVHKLTESGLPEGAGTNVNAVTIELK